MALNATSKKDLEDFKTYILVERNFSQHTAKAYYADILAFLIWLDEQMCEEVTFAKVREYLHFIQIFNYKKQLSQERLHPSEPFINICIESIKSKIILRKV